MFDQGSTLCKETDVGPGTGVATSWNIPPNTATDCVILPIIKAGRVANLGDIPYQGQAITPTCDPELLSDHRAKVGALASYVARHPTYKGTAVPVNSFFNQLGCSISHAVANTPQTATSYLFVSGIKGGLFSIALNNVAGPESRRRRRQGQRTAELLLQHSGR